MRFIGPSPKQLTLQRIALGVLILATIAGLAVADLEASDDWGLQITGQNNTALPQEGQSGDSEENLTYLFAVYIITWGGFFAYVFVVSRRQKELHRDITVLKQLLSDREDGSSNGPRTGASDGTVGITDPGKV